MIGETNARRFHSLISKYDNGGPPCSFSGCILSTIRFQSLKFMISPGIQEID